MLQENIIKIDIHLTMITAEGGVIIHLFFFLSIIVFLFVYVWADNRTKLSINTHDMYHLLKKSTQWNFVVQLYYDMKQFNLNLKTVRKFIQVHFFEFAAHLQKINMFVYVWADNRTKLSINTHDMYHLLKNIHSESCTAVL